MPRELRGVGLQEFDACDTGSPWHGTAPFRSQQNTQPGASGFGCIVKTECHSNHLLTLSSTTLLPAWKRLIGFLNLNTAFTFVLQF
jgi:hypothetical protein